MYAVNFWYCVLFLPSQRPEICRWCPYSCSLSSVWAVQTTMEEWITVKEARETEKEEETWFFFFYVSIADSWLHLCVAKTTGSKGQLRNCLSKRGWPRKSDALQHTPGGHWADQCQWLQCHRCLWQCSSGPVQTNIDTECSDRPYQYSDSQSRANLRNKITFYAFVFGVFGLFLLSCCWVVFWLTYNILISWCFLLQYLRRGFIWMMHGYIASVELYPLTPVLVILTWFQSHSSIGKVNLQLHLLTKVLFIWSTSNFLQLLCAQTYLD